MINQVRAGLWLALCAALLSCNKESKGAAPGATSASATPAGASTAATSAALGGEMTVTWSMGEVKGKKLRIGAAFAYITGTKDEPELEIRLFNANLKDAKDCDYDIPNFGKGITEDQLSIQLKTSGVHKNVPFANKPGKLEKVGYTVYYRSPGKDSGTNSGNSAGREDMSSTLEIKSLDDKALEGSWVLKGDGDDIQASFRAKVCARELRDPSE